MAEAIVGPLLSKLQAVAVKEAQALAAVGGEIDKLRDKLMWLQALVHETDLRSRHDSSQLVRVLACQIREVAFEAEDAVDQFYLQADISRRFGRNWRRAAMELIVNFRTHICVRFILSRRIQSMNARLEEIVENNSKYSSGQGGSVDVSTSSWRASRAIPPMRHDWDNENTVSFIDRLDCRIKKKMQLNDILRNKSGPKVISVVGVGGVGKRALLRHAYTHASTNKYFDACVCLSFPPGIADSSMAQQIKERLIEECSFNEDLKNKNLEEVSYLVVIESPVGATTWSKVEPKLLRMAGESSKILLPETSSRPGQHDEDENNEEGIIKLDPLKKRASVRLFNHAYGLHGRKGTKYQTQEMDNIRCNIMEITNGLPLAVVLVAKLMRTMDFSKWKAASAYLMTNHEDNKLKTILLVCVDDLPDELKSCLFYAAGFPENRSIDAHQLVRLWMAEGFLTQQHGVETEQLGQCYLKELIYRGLLQLISKTSAHGGHVEWIAIPDQIHPLLRSEAQRTGFMDVHYGGCVPAPGNSRRLALHNYNNEFPALDNCLDKLRTVVSYSDDYPRGSKLNAVSSRNNEPVLDMSKFLQGSPYLRVIDLEGIKVLKGKKKDVCALPNEIGEMVHLQYLCVRCQLLEKVTSSIGNLGQLQTIDVRGTGVRKLPKSLWKIKTLRHVLGDELAFPRSTGDLKLIQTLETMTIKNVDNWRSCTRKKKRVKNLGLRFLRRLHVMKLNESQRGDLDTILEDLSSLDSLGLSGEAIPIDLFAGASEASASYLKHVVSLELDGKLAPDKDICISCPDSCFLKNLAHLELRNTKIAQEFIHMIAKLPVLAELVLLEDSYVGKELVLCRHGFGFNSLTVLRISGLATLKIIFVPGATTRRKKVLIHKPDQVQAVETRAACRFCLRECQQPAGGCNQQANGAEDGQSSYGQSHAGASYNIQAQAMTQGGGNATMATETMILEAILTNGRSA